MCCCNYIHTVCTTFYPKHPRVQAEAKAALEKLCGILPSTLSTPVSIFLVVVVSVVVVVVDFSNDVTDKFL